MKKVLSNFVLFVVMLILIFLLGTFGYAIYMDLNTEDIIKAVSGNQGKAFNEEPEEIKKTTISEALANMFAKDDEAVQEYSSKKAEDKYFYKQLTDNQKKIYNGLLENKENMITGTYVIDYGSQFSELLQQENGSKILGYDYQAAVDAYLQDNVDMFYIDVTKLYLHIEKNVRAFNTTFKVCIGPAENSTYYNSNYKTEVQVRKAIKMVEAKKKSIISSLSGSDYKKIKEIHNYLVKNIEYDQHHVSKETYTIYGALIDNKCVCEGYAKTFKYLANSVGIDCELVRGVATNSSGITENHVWNAVYLDNNWYYIDVTWDDPIIIGHGIVLNSTRYRYFLVGKKTLDKDHVIEKAFSNKGREFTTPKVGEKDYK